MKGKKEGKTLAEVFAKEARAWQEAAKTCIKAGISQEVADELARVVADNPYILWIDYGCYEGWKPQRFANLDDAAKFIQEGGTCGQQFLVTKEVPLLKQVEQL